MGASTTIEWTDATWNPIGGCEIASPGCIHCYAQGLCGTRLKTHPLYEGTTSLVKGKPVFNGTLTQAADDHKVWRWPVTWRGAKQPKLGAGKPSLIFVGDMSDLFHKNRPRAVIDKVVGGIIHSRHIGQLLTKRADVMCDYFEDLHADGRWFHFPHPLFGKPNFAPSAWVGDALIPRLWLGISAERQKEFDERWPYLRVLAALGYTVFVSYEPAIGPLRLPDDFLALGRRAQVISGGESGKNARPPHPRWFPRLRDQCAEADVAYFHKQNGEWAPAKTGIEEGDITVWPDGHVGNGGANEHGGPGWGMYCVGKHAAGALLDGREHREFPA